MHHGYNSNDISGKATTAPSDEEKKMDNRQILNLHGNFIRAKRAENDFLNEATGNEKMKA